MDLSPRCGSKALLAPVLLLVIGALAACADNPPPDHPGRGERAEHRGRGDPGHGSGEGVRREAAVNIFFSPAGKPFRAARGELYVSAVWFAAADANGDGRLTRDEFLKDAEVFFHQLDSDHDGIVDGFELTTYEKVIAPEILQGFRPERESPGAGAPSDSGGGRGGGRHGGGGGGGRHGGSGGRGGEGGGGAAPSIADTKPQGAAWFSYLDVPEPVAAADRELNNRITLKEFLATADERFKLLDVAGRGYLVLDELPKTPVQMMRGGPRGR
jgi:hypothetical protein